MRCQGKGTAGIFEGESDILRKAFLFSSARHDPGCKRNMELDHSQFSEREKEVIALLLQGKSNKQIALALNIAQSTVEYHLKNIYQKLEVSSRTEAVLRLGKSSGGDTTSEVAGSTAVTDSKLIGKGDESASLRGRRRNKTPVTIGILLIIIITAVAVVIFKTSSEDTAVNPCELQPAFRESPPSPQEWQDQILYAVDPRNTEGLDGLRRCVPYLKALGVTTVFLENVISSQNFQMVNPEVGTNEELSLLITDLHATNNGPRINAILDIRMASTSRDHDWAKRPDVYPGYYRLWNEENKTENIGCTGEDSCEPLMLNGIAVDHFQGTPVLDHTNGMEDETGPYRDVRDAIFWLADQFEVDGFRYATAHYYHADFWPRFMRDFRMRYGEEKNTFWHIAEVFIFPQANAWQISPREFINPGVGNIEMTGAHDFELTAFIYDVFVQGKDPTQLVQHLAAPGNFDDPGRITASVNRIGTTFLQDVEIYNENAEKKNENPRKSLYLAYVFLLTSNRVPLIQSGHEFGFDASQEENLFTGDLDQIFYENFRKLIRIRRDYTAFRRGTVIRLEPPGTIISYARQDEEETFIVVLNHDKAPASIDIKLSSRDITCNWVDNLLEENFLEEIALNLRLRNLGTGATTLNVDLDPWEAKVIQCFK